MNIRVPIFPHNLEDGGFTRLAKRLKRDWLDARPLRLSEAQEILSRCLGYSSYHDFAQAVELHSDDVDFPTLQLLTVEIILTIRAELYDTGHCKAFDLGELQETIYNWPFLLLSASRNHYGNSESYIVIQTTKADNIETLMSAQTLPPEYHPEALKFGFSSQQLHAIMGHYEHLTTKLYMPNRLPMGVCSNNGPSETARELLQAQYHASTM